MTEAKTPDEGRNWAIDIFLFSNGQESTPPRKYHLTYEELHLWEGSLTSLAREHYGNKHTSLELYSTNGIKIDGPLKLIDGQSYVAVIPPDKFIEAGYDNYLVKASRSWEKRQNQKGNKDNDEHTTEEDNKDKPCCGPGQKIIAKIIKVPGNKGVKNGNVNPNKIKDPNADNKKQIPNTTSAEKRKTSMMPRKSITSKPTGKPNTSPAPTKSQPKAPIKSLSDSKRTTIDTNISKGKEDQKPTKDYRKPTKGDNKPVIDDLDIQPIKEDNVPVKEARNIKEEPNRNSNSKGYNIHVKDTTQNIDREIISITNTSMTVNNKKDIASDNNSKKDSVPLKNITEKIIMEHVIDSESTVVEKVFQNPEPDDRPSLNVCPETRSNNTDSSTARKISQSDRGVQNNPSGAKFSTPISKVPDTNAGPLTEDRYMAYVGKGDVIDFSLRIEVKNKDAEAKPPPRCCTVNLKPDLSKTEKESQVDSDGTTLSHDKSIESTLTEAQPSNFVIICCSCDRASVDRNDKMEIIKMAADEKNTNSVKYVIVVAKEDNIDNSEGKCNCVDKKKPPEHEEESAHSSLSAVMKVHSETDIFSIHPEDIITGKDAMTSFSFIHIVKESISKRQVAITIETLPPQTEKLNDPIIGAPSVKPSDEEVIKKTESLTAKSDKSSHEYVDESTSTSWSNTLLEVRLEDDGHYSFHLPPLNATKCHCVE